MSADNNFDIEQIKYDSLLDFDDDYFDDEDETCMCEISDKKCIRCGLCQEI